MNQLFTVLVFGSVILSAVCIIWMPELIRMVTDSLSEEMFTKTVNMSRVLMVSPIMMGISNLLSVHAHQTKRFLIISLSPLLYNLCTVVGVYALYNKIGYMSLTYAIIFSAFMHMVVQVFSVSYNEKLPRFVTSIDFRRVKNVLYQAAPRTFALVATPLMSLIVFYFSSELPEGSISLLAFAVVIQNVPVNLISNQIATAFFPTLVDVSQDTRVFSQKVERVFSLLFLFSLISSALLFVLSDQVVSFLLKTGNFSKEHVESTGLLVSVLSLGAVFQGLSVISSRIYWARGYSWYPAIVNAFGIALGSLYLYIQSKWATVSMIDLSVSLLTVWVVNGLVNYISTGTMFKERGDWVNMSIGIVKSLLVAAVSGVIAWYLSGFLYFNGGNTLLIGLSVVSIASVAVFSGVFLGFLIKHSTIYNLITKIKSVYSAKKHGK